MKRETLPDKGGRRSGMIDESPHIPEISLKGEPVETAEVMQTGVIGKI